MRRVGAAILVAAAAMLTGCAATPPVGHAEMRLVGTWAGSSDASGDGVIELVVAEAASDGSVFEGSLTFSAGGAESTERAHGALTPNGHMVIELERDASVEVHIVDPSTLDYCFIRYGDDPVYSCGRLERAT